jgi:hypothetical protein
MREEGLLRSLFIYHLVRITLLAEEPHADDGHSQIAGRLELIASDVAKPARVNREGFAQHELHTEVGHRR